MIEITVAVVFVCVGVMVGCISSKGIAIDREHEVMLRHIYISEVNDIVNDCKRLTDVEFLKMINLIDNSNEKKLQNRQQWSGFCNTILNMRRNERGY